MDPFVSDCGDALTPQLPHPQHTLLVVGTVILLDLPKGTRETIEYDGVKNKG
jgi:hypothetical protein